MKRFLVMILAGTAVLIGTNWAAAQNAVNPDGLPADMEYSGTQAPMNAPMAADGANAYYADNGSGCSAGYDTGCSTGCDTGCDACAGRYDCYNCYNGVGYGYGCGFGLGCCSAGVSSVVCGTAEAVLTPVHWVASLLSCGTFADCGCAPLPCRTYSNPCDNCGNWQGYGGCSSCGENTGYSTGYESGCGCEYGQAMPNQNNQYNGKMNSYAKMNIKTRQMQQPMMVQNTVAPNPLPVQNMQVAQNLQNAPQKYIYQEQPVNRQPQKMNRTTIRPVSVTQMQ